MSERAEARQVLEDAWAANPAVYNGQGGSTYNELAVGSATVQVSFDGVNVVPVTYTAARTWVLGANGTPDHWAVVVNRYNHNTGEVYSSTGCPFGKREYPGADAGKQFFVPVAIKVIQTVGQSQQDYFSPQDTRVIVTGYGKSLSAPGNTDFRTLFFDGDLGDPAPIAIFSAKMGTMGAHPPLVDEFPVGMDALVGGGGTSAIIAVTGNTWSNASWQIATVFYDVNGVQQFANVQGSSSDPDMAAGISLGGSTDAAIVIGTMNVNAIGNSIKAFRYAIPGAGGQWLAPTVATLTVSDPGATLSANAMTARINGFSDLGVVAGRLAGIDSSYMLLGTFNFRPNPNSPTVDFTTFAPPPPNPSLPAVAATANAVAITTGLIDPQNPHTLFAVAGSGWRGAAYGMDSLVCLFDDVGAPLHLRWSSWMNQNDTPYAMDDSCYGVAIDSVSLTTDIDKFYVYAAGQQSNGTDLDWKISAYSSVMPNGADPANPFDKSAYASTLVYSGSVATPSPFSSDFVEVPISLVPSLNLEGGTTGPRYHNFVITGNIYNGTTPGADQLTRRVRFFAPE